MGTTRVARCRVCHRELTNPAHIAAGVGPVCAQRSARRASVTDGAAARRASVTDGAAAYPAAKVERINRNVARLAAMMARKEQWSAEAYGLIVHWYGRWRMIQIAVQRQQTARAW